MAVDVERLLNAVDIVAVIGSHIPLTKRGREYEGLCPFHDDSDPSLRVVPEKGFYHCHSCGAHGDAIDFLREKDGMTFQQACDALNANAWVPAAGAPAQRKAKEPAAEWVSSKPPKDRPEPPSFASRQYGEPVAKWAYRDASGDVLFWVARYKNGTKKVILCWSWGSDGTASNRWACRHYSKPRPLYGLDRLAARPDVQVVVLEGEGKCDSAGRLLPSLVNTAWPGGAQAVKHADWTPLYGRKVLLIPDADEPGREAVAWLRAHLEEHGCSVKVADPERGLPEGWNLDDAERDGWTADEVLDWARARVQGKLPTPRIAKAPEPEPPPAEPEAPSNVAYINEAAEVAAALDSAAARDEEGLPPAFSEDALAASFALHHAKNFRFVSEWGSWFTWTNSHWAKDQVLGVIHAARLTCRLAANWGEKDLTVAQQRQITSIKTISAVERLARATPQMAARTADWDADPWLLNTPGGVLELLTGEHRPSRREDYCTKMTGAAMDNKGCPLWLNFIKTITNGDAELATYLQRLAGYALTGVTTEQMLAFCYGTGANGKGVFLNTLRAIMGDYGQAAPMDAFVEARGERHPTEIAALRGARIVTVQEIDQNRGWAESRVLSLTGGDPVKARFMRQDEFEFLPQFKLMFAGNHKPSLRSANEAMRRRLHIIPFTVTIPPEKRDGGLSQRLKDEWGGILAWMLEGCIEWQKKGLKPPNAVRNTSAEYIAQEDTILNWIEECCDSGNGKKCSTKNLYQSFVRWAEESGERPGKSRAFVQNLRERNFRIYASGGYNWVDGLDVRHTGLAGVPSWVDD